MSYLNPELAVLDLDLLATLRSLDAGKGKFLNELIELYSQDSLPIFQNLLRSHEEAALHKVVFYAHRLKGMSGNIGILRLYRAFEAIELSYAEIPSRDLLSMAEILLKEYDLALSALHKDWWTQDQAS